MIHKNLCFRTAFFALLLALSAFFIGTAHAADSYRTYQNSLYGFNVEYPSNLLKAGKIWNEGDGRGFSKSDPQIVLYVMRTNIDEEETIKQIYNYKIGFWKDVGWNIEHSELGDGWFVVSGHRSNGYVFYEKIVLWQGAAIEMAWFYPKSLKKRMDEPVTRSSRSFSAENFRLPNSAPEGIGAPSK